MHPIYLQAELDLEHTGQYVPFTIFGVAIITGFIILCGLLLHWDFPSWTAPSYIVFFTTSLIFDIVFINKIMPNGTVTFQGRQDNINIEIKMNKIVLFDGEVVDFSFWWGNYSTIFHKIDKQKDFIVNAGRGNQNLFLEFVYETGQKVILYEATLPWESVPQNWPLRARHISSDTMSFPTFKIKEMVSLLSNELEKK